jgi:hypothetical protein
MGDLSDDLLAGVRVFEPVGHSVQLHQVAKFWLVVARELQHTLVDAFQVFGEDAWALVSDSNLPQGSVLYGSRPAREVGRAGHDDIGGYCNDFLLFADHHIEEIGEVDPASG